jgi:hypothetical protein
MDSRPITDASMMRNQSFTAFFNLMGSLFIYPSQLSTKIGLNVQGFLDDAC